MVELAAQDAQLSTFVARGRLTPEELVAAYAAFVNSAPTRYILWDLSSASLAGMRTEQIRRLAWQVSRMGQTGKDCRQGGKTALVCTRDVECGMGRMLTLFLSMEDYPVNVQVFRDVKDAKAWLFRSHAQV
jgi:hypothetical protein